MKSPWRVEQQPREICWALPDALLPALRQYDDERRPQNPETPQRKMGFWRVCEMILSALAVMRRPLWTAGRTIVSAGS